MKKQEILNVILSIPKSIYFNLRVLGMVKGICLPIIISYKTRIKCISKGCISVPDNCYFGMIKIGINNGPFERGRGRATYINIESGKVRFIGKANIAADSVINISSGTCVFGAGFSANNGFVCSCEKYIEFKNNVLFGWNCTVIDGDGHKIINCDSKEVLNKPRPIIIGNDVWVAANSTLLKGTLIKANTVISSNSILNQKFQEGNVILAGKPATIVKRNIKWIR